VLKGGSGSINFQVDTVGAAPLPFITFGCTGLPVGTTCTFNPPTEDQLSSVVTMTVKTTGKNSASMPLSGPGEKPRSFYAALLLPLMGLLGFSLSGRRRKQARVRLALCAVGLLALLAFAGCGGLAGGQATTTAGTFQVTVTAATATDQASTTINLPVQ
jgi:hypothetical protein